MIKYENFPKTSINFAFLGYQENFPGTKQSLRISHGKRAIGVRVIEVLLYLNAIVAQKVVVAV